MPPIWDPWVRSSHWCVAILWLLNYWVTEDGETLHEWLGYGLFALICLRMLWGFVGTTHARFTDFWPTPTKFAHYWSQFPRWRDGHNPMGALMVLFLWTGILVTGVSGWLQTTDAYWGEEWPQVLHRYAADTVTVAAALHVTAVLVMGRVSRKPLIRAMISGR